MILKHPEVDKCRREAPKLYNLPAMRSKTTTADPSMKEGFVMYSNDYVQWKRLYAVLTQKRITLYASKEKYVSNGEALMSYCLVLRCAVTQDTHSLRLCVPVSGQKNICLELSTPEEACEWLTELNASRQK